MPEPSPRRSDLPVVLTTLAVRRESIFRGCSLGAALLSLCSLASCVQTLLPSELAAGGNAKQSRVVMHSPWIELRSRLPSEKAWKILKKTVDSRLEYPVVLESRDYFVTAWRDGIRLYVIIDRKKPFDALLKLESVRPVYPKDVEMQVREILWRALGRYQSENAGG